MPVARLARASDLPSLLSLFDVSEVSAVAQPRERAESIWRETLVQQSVRVFVSDEGDAGARAVAARDQRGHEEGRRLDQPRRRAERPRRGAGQASVALAISRLVRRGAVSQADRCPIESSGALKD
jgi:hypothetical protein